VFSWSGKIVGVYGDYSVAQHKWTAQQSYEGLPFECRMDKPRQLTRADLAVTLQVTSDTAVAVTLADILTSSVGSSAVIAVPSLMRTTPMIVSPSSLFAVVTPCHVDSARSNALYPDAFAFSCGYADGGMRWQSVAHKTKSDCWVPSASKMVDVCTLTVAEDRCTLLTGHCDGSAHLWIVSHNSTIDWVNVVESASSSFDPHALGHLQATVSTAAVPMLRGESSDIMAIHVGTLYAQKSPITCVAANRLLCIAVTGALDGKIVISSLSTAKPLRVIYVADVTAAIPEGALPHGCSLFPQHAVITSAGYVCVAFLAHSPVAANSTVLALIHLNGSIVSAIHIAGSRKGSLAKYSLVTALSTSRDGTAIVVGFEDGTLEVRHGLTLECGSFAKAHTEFVDAQASAYAAVLATDASAGPNQPPTPSGGTTSSAPSPAPSIDRKGLPGPLGSISAGFSAAKTTIGGAFSRLGKGQPASRGEPENNAAPATLLSLPVIAPGPHQYQRVSAAAITSLAFSEDDRVLLAGTGDGRLCIITDPGMAQRTLANTLQQGLFSLV
jgi:hypothetical protein